MTYWFSDAKRWCGYGGQLIAGTVTGVEPRRRTRVPSPSSPVGSLSDRSAPDRGGRGLRDELPDIPGIRERWGRDLLHCPYCHGYEVRDQQLGALGGRPTRSSTHCWCASGRRTSSSSHTPTRSPQMSGSNSSPATSASSTVDVTRLVVDDDLLSRDRTRQWHDHWPHRGFRPSASDPEHRSVWPRWDARSTTTGWVKVDTTGRTSLPGVWVAGNAANPRAQVITAAGEGSSVAIAVNADLVGEDVQHAVRNLPPGATAPDHRPRGHHHEHHHQPTPEGNQPTENGTLSNDHPAPRLTPAPPRSPFSTSD